MDVGCGGVLTGDINNVGTFTSPNHPTEYAHNALCLWIIRAPPGYVVRLTFAMFSLEDDSSCRFDYVELRDGLGDNLGKFCGTRLPPVIQSRSDIMYVTFKSDESHARDGFAATFIFINGSTACGGHYYGDTGVIRSPGWPQNYPPSRQCTWTINANEGIYFVDEVSRNHFIVNIQVIKSH